MAVTNMSRAPKATPDPDQPGAFLPNGAAAKAGLNRSILDAAPSMLLGMLRTKAAEAASVFALADTRKVKPTFPGLEAEACRAPRSIRCRLGTRCGSDLRPADLHIARLAVTKGQ